MVRHFTSASGRAIAVGESAAENQALCKSAKQNDEWFHLDGSPSAHAILSLEGAAATRDDIHDCAQLVKRFSKQRDSARTYVIHIPAKFVSKNGAEDKLGSVTLKKKPTRIPVSNDDDTLERLVGGPASGTKKGGGKKGSSS